MARRIVRLREAVEVGGDAASLVARIRELEARAAAIVHESSGLRPVPRLDRVVIETRLTEWRRLLRQSTTQGRAVLQRVLRGRITFTPLADGRAGYAFHAPTRFDKLFTGVATPRPAFIRADDRTGLAGITPADTCDGDYGRLLERAYDRFNGKGVTSPTGFEPVF